MQTPLDFWRGCQPLGSRSMTIPTPAHYVSVVSPEWTVPYTATVADSGLHYQAVHDDVDILNHHRITDIMCLIGVRYVQEFRVTLVQAAAWTSVGLMAPTQLSQDNSSMLFGLTGCRPRRSGPSIGCWFKPVKAIKNRPRW